MKYLIAFLLLFTLSAFSESKQKKDSLLNLNKQVSDNLRKKNLEEKNPIMLPKDERAAEPDVPIKMECDSRIGGCDSKIIQKSVVRPDGVKLK